MFIHIDSSKGAPLWQQIVQQVTRQVMSGSLNVGDRLLTVRELASELRINPNTVARAYMDLEREGIVETRRGAGTFVCDITRDKTSLELRKIIEQQFDSIIVEALHINLTKDQLLTIFTDRLQAVVSQNAKETVDVGELAITQEGIR